MILYLRLVTNYSGGITGYLPTYIDERPISLNRHTARRYWCFISQKEARPLTRKASVSGYSWRKSSRATLTSWFDQFALDAH